mgnify:FL=1
MADGLKAGDQLPSIPLIEVVGKLIIVPEHNGPIELNTGAVTGFTVMLKVVVVAH